ncbi:hypothetical protein J6590_101543 [Homalodisca vitripennis]|nr:hypothetical protein J6590_101543 [Homalodisca vitripennis]
MNELTKPIKKLLIKQKLESIFNTTAFVYLIEMLYFWLQLILPSTYTLAEQGRYTSIQAIHNITSDTSLSRDSAISEQLESLLSIHLRLLLRSPLPWRFVPSPSMKSSIVGYTETTQHVGSDNSFLAPQSQAKSNPLTEGSAFGSIQTLRTSGNESFRTKLLQKKNKPRTNPFDDYDSTHVVLLYVTCTKAFVEICSLYCGSALSVQR